MAAPKGMWECPNCGNYLDDTVRVCPRCNRGPNNSGFGATSLETRYQTRRSSEGKGTVEKEAATIKPSQTMQADSAAAMFLRIIAWILWIGGFIASIISASGAKINRYGDASFSFSVFITTFLIYLVVGGFTMCAVELFENVQRIANALQGFTITKKDDSDQ